MSIDNKFEINQWANQQLTDRAFVELWQTSGSINQVEERYGELKDEYHKSKAISRQDFSNEINAKKFLIIDCTKDEDGDPVYLSSWEFRRAEEWLEAYDRPGGYERHCRRTCFAPKESIKRTARRLKKNGVALRKLKRIGPSVYYHSRLNEYAQSFK